MTDSLQEHSGQPQQCLVCDYITPNAAPNELGQIRGNTARFQHDTFPLWKCPKCEAIHSINPVDMADIYSDYPLNSDRTLDVFARGTFRNLLRRLTSKGLEKQHSIIDYGCGNGVYIEFLRGLGYTNVTGYDPYVAKFAQLPETPASGYDCVIANDVIEHVDSPRQMMLDCLELVRPGGLLYIGTADSGDVKDMSDLEHHILRLHQPFHRVIVTQQGLLDLGHELKLEMVQTRRRSYMDTLMPFSNYRFLDEFNGAHGHILDAALAPDAASIVARKPWLLFYALFGYFLPSAMEPSVLWRKPIA